MIGKNPRIFNSGEKPKEDYPQLWSSLLSGREWTREFHNKKKNGKLYWESTSMNGYEATREIRKFNKNVIIIAQTAFASSGDKEKAMDAGCNGLHFQTNKQKRFTGINNQKF